MPIDHHSAAPIPFDLALQTPDDHIMLRAFGESIALLAPKNEFLRNDSLWRLQNIYHPALATQTLAQCGVALDIGAGFGAFAVPFALAYPDWRVFCFEPDPLAFAYLQKNIQDLSLTQVTALPFAIGCQKEDAPQDANAVRVALGRVMAGDETAIDRLGAVLPIALYSKSKINMGYLERGHNRAEEFDPVHLPTLAAVMLDCLSPRLLKITAPMAESGILSDLSDAQIDHVIGETWSHVPSALIHKPAKGQRQTWLRRAGTDQLALRKAAYLGGRTSTLDIIFAPCAVLDDDLASLDALLSDPSDDFKVLAVLDPDYLAADDLLALFGNDSRLCVLQTPSGGSAPAWNVGRKQSTATHIAFVEGGSLAEIGFFSHLLDLARYTGAEVVQGPHYTFDAEGPDQVANGLGNMLLRDDAAVGARYPFSDRHYHLCATHALMAQDAAISRRVYRRDYLDSRDIWFPDTGNHADKLIFQTLSLHQLPHVAELDGASFAQRAQGLPPQDRANSILESFRVLIKRAVRDGWNDFEWILQSFAAQINSITPELDPQARTRFLRSMAQLWAQAGQVLNVAAFDLSLLNLIRSAEFLQHALLAQDQIKDSDILADFDAPLA